MSVRNAVVSGRFYEANPDKCQEHIRQMLQMRALDPEMTLPDKILAAIVPHAGWVFSGDIAAQAFAAVEQQNGKDVDTFVIFGAVHSVRTRLGLLYDRGQWATPLGKVNINEELAQQILEATTGMVCADRAGHSNEHSIEVQIPIIQYIFPNAQIVPLMIPPVDSAENIGRSIGGIINQSDKKIVCIASTDLTHYGPSYYFTPHGTGPEALGWAKEHNDRFFLEHILSLRPDQLINTAAMYGSACGAGATAAALTSAIKQGAQKSTLLAHTTSAEVMARQFHQQTDDSVGYAGIVIG